MPARYLCPVTIILILFRLTSSSPEYISTGCGVVGKKCILWRTDNNGTIEVDDRDFQEIASRVDYINTSVSLVNTSLETLPRAPLLMKILGSLQITDNPLLTYTNEWEHLESVTGGVNIRNNPRLQLPLSVYNSLCARSSCDVDVICKGNLMIREDSDVNFRDLRKCTILEGDIIVLGLIDGGFVAMNLDSIFRIHTVLGAVRLIHNELNSFEFLKSVKRIEYSGDAGCALSVLLKSSIQMSANIEIDNSTGVFPWGFKKSNTQWTRRVLIAATCAFAGISISVLIFWAVDCKFGILFYKKSASIQRIDNAVDEKPTCENEARNEMTDAVQQASNAADTAVKAANRAVRVADKYFGKYGQNNIAGLEVKAINTNCNVPRSQYANPTGAGSIYINV